MPSSLRHFGARRRFIRPTIALCALFFLVLFGCQTGFLTAKRPQSFRRTSPPRSTVPESGVTTILIGDEPFRRSVALAGAINETVSFRFSLQVGTEPIPAAGLVAGALQSDMISVGASAIEIFRMHPVSSPRLPGWSIRSIAPNDRPVDPLDVLVPIGAPRGGLPETLSPGVTYHFWVDVNIPKGAFEGMYASSLELTSGERSVGVIDLKLKVWPFILPDRIDIPLVAELDHRVLFGHHVRYQGRSVTFVTDDWRLSPKRDELDRLLRSTVVQLQRHRLTPILSKLTPAVTINARGTVSVDWEAYDAVVQPYLNGRAFQNRVPVSLWPVPVQAVLSSPQPRAWLASPERVGLLRQYLAECAGHFHDKGWLERAYTTVPGAAVYGAESIGALRDFVEVATAADERLPIVSRLWPQDMAPYGWTDYAWTDFATGIDIWLPPAQFYDPQRMASARSTGQRTWLSIDRPPYSGTTAVHAPPAFVKVLTWQAERLGAEAVFLGVINRWPLGRDDVTPTECVEADPNVLLYPGRRFGLSVPVASVRLKYLRQSAESAAYRALLLEHGLGHVVSALSSAVASRGGTEAYGTHFADARPIAFSVDGLHFDMARRIMAEELIKKVQVRRGTRPSDEFKATAMWRRFMPATRAMRLTVDGVRMRLVGPRTQWEAEAECTVTVTNGTRLPAAGTIGVTGPLAPAWTTNDVDRPVGLIRPGSSRRIMLVAELNGLPTNPTGAMALPVSFVTQKGDESRVEARVSLITAVPFDGTVRIDGDLSDWPPGLANVAADFRSISQAESTTQGDTGARPAHRTIAFVRRDSEYLYVAINSEYDGPVGRQRASRNRVDYDDMIPVGEELVEVLIDPLNAGTRTPEDLYHIVVKPSGSYLVEKGIRFEPPCGARSPWPVDIVVSTMTFKDRWTVEMRIPLEAFGEDEVGHTIWGFNVTRFDAARQEFSTWSGARGNAYDPLSLGNLYLP